MWITAVPAQHFSGRTPFDRDKTLWCGFMLQTEPLSIYFAGDTGKGPHIEEIARRFPDIDLAILPIGAYRPEWFMGEVHMSRRMRWTRTERWARASVSPDILERSPWLTMATMKRCRSCTRFCSALPSRERTSGPWGSARARGTNASVGSASRNGLGLDQPIRALRRQRSLQSLPGFR